jgi:hypothetical protein
LLKTLYFDLEKKKKGLVNWGVGFWQRCRVVLGIVGEVCLIDAVNIAGGLEGSGRGFKCLD